MVYALIDHRNDAIKCSKLWSETTRLRLVVPLEFWTFYDVTSMVYKSAGHGKLCGAEILSFPDSDVVICRQNFLACSRIWGGTSIFKWEWDLYLLVFFNGSRGSSYFLLLPTYDNFFLHLSSSRKIFTACYTFSLANSAAFLRAKKKLSWLRGK